MNISSARGVYFSPTGTSKRIVQAICNGLEGVSDLKETDLTYPECGAGDVIGKNDLAVIGVPVYAGRVPAIAVERLQGIKGDGTPAVIVVVYGNREFEDALVELRDIVTANGFCVAAAGAFIGEHSFSTPELPIAAGRPDAEDIQKAKAFGSSLMKLLVSAEAGGAEDLSIPGNVPYQDGMKNLPFTPVVDQEVCTQCGICIEKCPTGAISLTDVIAMEVDSCILCASCIKVCPEEAVSLKATPMAERMVALNKNCSARKEPQLFF